MGRAATCEEVRLLSPRAAVAITKSAFAGAEASQPRAMRDRVIPCCSLSENHVVLSSVPSPVAAAGVAGATCLLQRLSEHLNCRASMGRSPGFRWLQSEWNGNGRDVPPPDA